MTPSTPPIALTIAGTDSGGGAGISADLKTFAALGVFGTLVVTAVTAQNTTAVTKIDAMAPELVDAQLDAVLDDFSVAAAKTGMLANAEIVERVAARAASGALRRLVVDPVMVAASGGQLLEGDARRAYLDLAPFATVLTPNLAEAEALLGGDVRDERAMEQAALELNSLGATAVVVKGGHLEGVDAADAVAVDGEVTWLRAPWVTTRNVHGTGCVLSAAIAAKLAHGADVLCSIAAAKRFLQAALERSANGELGHGSGPLAFLNERDPDS